MQNNTFCSDQVKYLGYKPTREKKRPVPNKSKIKAIIIAISQQAYDRYEGFLEDSKYIRTYGRRETTFLAH